MYTSTFQETLDVATEPWGVKVERVEVKDVRVPAQLMRAMAAEAEAAREARAKVYKSFRIRSSSLIKQINFFHQGDRCRR